MLKRFLVLLAAAAALSTAAFAQAESAWTKYTSPTAKFSILVPCTFKVTTGTVKAPGGDIEQTYHQCLGAPRYYIVSAAQFATAPAAADRQAVMEGFRSGVVESMKGMVVSEKPFTAAGNSGIEFVMSQTKDGMELIYKWRVHLAEKMLYGTGVATAKSNLPAPEVDKFLTSFSLQ